MTDAASISTAAVKESGATSTGKKGRAASGFNIAAHGLRGLASFMVFAAHLLGGTAEHIYYGNSYYVALVERPWNFGRWGVELFFTISGFVILPSIMRYAPRQFALRRFFRLYPLFFAFTLLFAILNAATNAYPNMNNGLSVFSAFTFLNLFTGTEQLTPNAWSLTYEVIFYALACMTFHTLFRKADRPAAIFSIFLCLLFITIFPIAIYFLFGIAVKIMMDRGMHLRGRTAHLVEIAAFIACLYCASTRHFGYSHDELGDPLLPATMVATCIYFLCAVTPGSISEKLLANRLFFYLGTVSYSLYLFHPYSYFAMRAVFNQLGLFTENWLLSMTLFFIATMALTFPINHMVHRILEIGPYQWFFHQRIYRQGNGGKKGPPHGG